ncbi:hypothetical protein [Paludibacterium sp.]|uniref:hypothetical protein n=1 Tax=Paludibacterium sp. TaxID=1917523 RepID=UPI0025E76806|nr:hypothetical protein [Paludibacterium sp.]MBV8647711.1 hypothetical protein [Paludibacterium sp.]
MTTAAIVLLIDLQNGFAHDGLTAEQGGSLYVPGGEQVGRVAAGLVRDAHDTVFVLSQDFHPADHISFAANHGVEPFSTIKLSADAQGVYRVDVGGTLAQTAWPDHCKQGTESAQLVDELLAELPADLSANLASAEPVLFARDGRGNAFYVVRKGTRRDLDSYGIATENDGVSTTRAPAVFAAIAETWRQAGVTDARIAIGGLATNFCVEFSHDDIYRYLVPALQARGIGAQVFFLADISAGIAVSADDGAWPDLAAATDRMAQKGTRISRVADWSAQSPAGRSA